MLFMYQRDVPCSVLLIGICGSLAEMTADLLLLNIRTTTSQKFWIECFSINFNITERRGSCFSK